MFLYFYGLTFTTVLSMVHCYASNTSNFDFYEDELRSLSELPLEKLIRIKSSFSRKNQIDDYDDMIPEARTLSAMALPMTMPLKRSSNVNRPIRRYEEWEEKGHEPDSKISKIFQLTVTTLSFLAFGGYLLTLIISAIKKNQMNNNMNPGVIVLSGLNSLQKIKRPKRGLVIYDPAENEYDTEMMYRGMIMLSSDYSKHYYR